MSEKELVPGRPDARGYRRLREAAAPPPSQRNELARSAPSGALRSVVSFVHLSDLHVTDVQSPARAEFLDRHGDPDAPHALRLGRIGTYRAQEALTFQVVEAMAQAVRASAGGPLTGAPFAFAITTGDSTDNCQENELEAYVALLEGERVVVPDSGDPGRYEGVGSSEHYDVRYWHPDGTPEGCPDDLPRSIHGLPVVPGLLDACRRPFVASGLGLPWFAVYGNHDALFGGTLPPAPSLADLATGDAKPYDLAPDVDVVSLLEGNETSPSIGSWGLRDAAARAVTADASRRPVTRREWIAAHLGAGAEPAGHGFRAEDRDADRAYYGFDAGVVRGIVLDTVNAAGGWQGSLDSDQMAWLERELAAGHSSYLAPSGELVRGGAEDRLFVLFSHHSVETLINDFAPDGARRHLGDAVVALLLRFPNVVAWFNGHTHVHAVRPIVARDAPGRGFWQVTTASCIDWPQQGRLVELALDETTGNLVIGTAPLDHAGLADPRGAGLDDPLALAGWSRELSLNAWQGRALDAAGRDLGEPIGRGSDDDRRVVLGIPAPFELAARAFEAAP